MKSATIFPGIITAGILLTTACNRNLSLDHVHESQPPLTVGAYISDTTTGGTVKGTMLTGVTYNITRNLIVNAGDTLVVQPGVTVCIADMQNIAIIIRGVLLSLGTQAQPNWFTVCGITKEDNVSEPPASDPAYAGHWYGINCDTTCPLCVFKWTHVEFGGENVVTAPVSGLAVGSPSYNVFFGNLNGSFVFEDSWIYGSNFDAIRIACGKMSVMRNTFEKCGGTSGEGCSTKSGSVGDEAYNLFMGACDNGSKLSNADATPVQHNVRCYNNTYIDNGYRDIKPTTTGGSINLEKGGTGMVYNNLIVNCRLGFRLVSTADTTPPGNAVYGNSYYYGDSIGVVDQFYPVGNVTHPEPTDFPNPFGGLLPANYTLGASYNAPESYVGANNPLFVNFPLPNPQYYQIIAYVTGYNFRLQSNSPAIGKGYTGFTAMGLIPVNPLYGPSEITQPGADIGCYQSNGTGNQH